MGDNTKKGMTAAAARPLCSVSRIHNGVEYRCSKYEGHDLDPSDEEHVTRAPEYADKAPDWMLIGLSAKPLLEWMAANEKIVGLERSELARRCLVKMYLAAVPRRPGLAKPSPAS